MTHPTHPQRQSSYPDPNAHATSDDLDALDANSSSSTANGAPASSSSSSSHQHHLSMLDPDLETEHKATSLARGLLIDFDLDQTRRAAGGGGTQETHRSGRTDADRTDTETEGGTAETGGSGTSGSAVSGASGAATDTDTDATTPGVSDDANLPLSLLDSADAMMRITAMEKERRNTNGTAMIGMHLAPSATGSAQMARGASAESQQSQSSYSSLDSGDVHANASGGARLTLLANSMIGHGNDEEQQQQEHRPHAHPRTSSREHSSSSTAQPKSQSQSSGRRRGGSNRSGTSANMDKPLPELSAAASPPSATVSSISTIVSPHDPRTSGHHNGSSSKAKSASAPAASQPSRLPVLQPHSQGRSQPLNAHSAASTTSTSTATGSGFRNALLAKSSYLLKRPAASSSTLTESSGGGYGASSAHTQRSSHADANGKITRERRPSWGASATLSLAGDHYQASSLRSQTLGRAGDWKRSAASDTGHGQGLANGQQSQSFARGSHMQRTDSVTTAATAHTSSSSGGSAQSSNRMPIAAQFAYSFLGSPSPPVRQVTGEAAWEGSGGEGKHQQQVLPPRPRSALGLLDYAASRRPESERPAQASSSASIPSRMETMSRSIGRRAQQGLATSPERGATGGMRGGKAPSSAFQRLQRTTASASVGHGKTTSNSNATSPPISASSLRIGSKNVFVSMATAASSSGHNSRRSEPTSTSRSTSRSQKQPTVLSSASSSNSHGVILDHEKALPARPKSALSGLFSRRHSSSLGSAASSTSSKHASKLSAPAPALTAASARVMPIASSAVPVEPKRPHTVLGGKLRGLTSLRGSSGKRLSTTTPSSSASASPAISPAASQTGLPDRARLGTSQSSRIVSNGKARIAALTRLAPSSASTPNVPSAAAHDQDNDRTIGRRGAPPPLSRSGSSATGEDLVTSRASSSDAGHSAPGSPALSFVTRRKSLLEAVFEPYHNNHHSRSTPVSAEVSPLASVAADGDHLTGSSGTAAHRSMPGSPNAFTRAVSHMRRHGSSHRSSAVIHTSGESVVDILAESALDDTASDAGHSGAHGSSSAGGHASPSTSRRPSRRGSVNMTMRGFSFTKSFYGALDRNSAPTSPILSATELALISATPAGDISSLSTGAAEHGFTKAAVHRASRSREVSAPVVLPVQSVAMDQSEELASLYPERIRPEHVLPPISPLGLVSHPIEGAVAELEPMPPTRSSSKSAALTIARRNAAQSFSGELGEASGRPALQIDTAVDGISRGPKTEDLLLSDRKPAFLTESASERKFSQPTFSMADDVEFLKALEEVRRLHKQSISQQGLAVEGMEPISRVNSSNHRAPQTQQQQHEQKQTQPPSNSASADVEMGKQRQRANSASGHLGGLYTAQSEARFTQAALDREQEAAGNLDAPLQVGRAAGKMQDGAFDNDEDWKKEVKALFVIRELVQTERSYARYLEGLMQAVRRLSNPQIASAKKDRRMSVEVVATHIFSLRTLLPQLIALSRALTSRIDKDPTAAGVGAAFRVVAPQLEATFVGWSFTIADIMNGLRSAEAPKSKNKDRIGLVYVAPETSRDVVGPGHARIPSSPSLPSAERSGASFSRATTTSFGGVEVDRSAEATPASSPAKRTMNGRSASSLGFAPLQAATFGRKAFGAGRNSSNKPSEQHPPSTVKVSSGKALSPLDIVIMPTQRIPRYLLLLKDLQRNTPAGSLSYLRVQKAFDIIQRVAELCDEASHNYLD